MDPASMFVGASIGAGLLWAFVRPHFNGLQADRDFAVRAMDQRNAEARQDDAEMDRLREQLVVEMQLRDHARRELAAAVSRAQAAQTQALDLQRQLREAKGRRERHREAERARRDERAVEAAVDPGAPRAKAVTPWR